MLRFLQERVVERVGGREEISVDVRVVCATNQNPRKMIDESTFREDLYYRVSKISRAAEMLGVTRPTLYDLLNKYGLSVEGYTKRANGGNGADEDQSND